MIMYWFPRLEIIGYLPVRSKYVVPDSFVASVKNQSCVLDSWVGNASASSFSFVEIVLVDLMSYCY